MSAFIRRVRKILRKKAIRVEDRFLTWLSFANAGMLNAGNHHCFEYAVSHLPSDNPIIEIGSFCGLSTNAITYFLRKHAKTNRVFTADRWVFEHSDELPHIGDASITHAEYRAFVKETFKRNVEFFSRSNLPHTIEAFSDEFFDRWSSGAEAQDVFGRTVCLGGKVSFVYIDGNHTYDYAARDFRNADRYLEKGGFVLFDDSQNYSSAGSAILMDEVLRNRDYRLILRNPNHLFMKIR